MKNVWNGLILAAALCIPASGADTKVKLGELAGGGSEYR